MTGFWQACKMLGKRKPIDLSTRQIPLRFALLPSLPMSSVPSGRQVIPVHDSLGADTLATGQEVQITTVATLIVPPRARAGIKLTNLSGLEIFWGPNRSVTVSSAGSGGDLIPAGRGQAIYVETCSAIWGIVASGVGSVSWAEIFDSHG